MAVCLAASASQPGGPALLSFDELKQLYADETPPPELQRKLNDLLTTPFVSNDASAQGVQPLKPATPGLGRCLIVAQWNIERGLEFDAIRLALSDSRKFSSLLENRQSKIDSDERARVLQQVETLKKADIIVLNEADWGVNRTLFRNVAGELADALHMNYAYGVEFVEVDPITMGIDQDAIVREVVKAYAPQGADKDEVIRRVREIMKPDPERYRGLHGTAILSRYPLTNVRLIPFRFQGHDWYADEKRKTSQVEKAEAKLSVTVFKEQLIRQVRRGGRMMLMADVKDPDLPSGGVTIVATHLEDLTKPSSRRKQLTELLQQIRDIRGPVIVAGDMNTSTHEGMPIGLKRLLSERFGSGKWWAKEGATEAIKYGTPAGWFYDLSHSLVGFARKVDDPTEHSIPLFGENPEAKFFTTLENFRFADGGAFDFRGDRTRSWKGREGKLANSNERAEKGFVPTDELEKTYGPVGEYKLDWIFVKPATLTSPYDRHQPYRFAPHRGRTMRRLNHSLPGGISDHSPITVALPFDEPSSPAMESYETAGH